MIDQGISLEILKLPLDPGYSFPDHIWLHRLLISLAADSRTPEQPQSAAISDFDRDFVNGLGVSLV